MSVFTTIRATCPTQSRQRPWFHCHLLKSGNHSSAHYAVFSSLPLTLPSVPQHPTLEHPQPVCFSEQERPTATSLQDNRHNYTAVHLYRYAAKQNAARLKTPGAMIARRPSIQYVIVFFIRSVSIWRCLSQIFNFAPFKVLICYLQTVTESCVLLTSQGHILIFSAFTSRPAVRLLPNKSSVVFYTVFVISLSTLTLAGGVAITNKRTPYN